MSKVLLKKNMWDRKTNDYFDNLLANSKLSCGNFKKRNFTQRALVLNNGKVFYAVHIKSIARPILICFLKR